MNDNRKIRLFIEFLNYSKNITNGNTNNRTNDKPKFKSIINSLRTNAIKLTSNSNFNSLNNNDDNTNNSINNIKKDNTDNSNHNSNEKHNKSFATTIYRKPTYTGLITKWDSYVPRAYKVSTISSMVYRAIKLCSSYDLMHEEFEFIEFIATQHEYLTRFVKAQIRKTLGRYFDKINGTQIFKTGNKNKIKHNKDNSIKKNSKCS